MDSQLKQMDGSRKRAEAAGAAGRRQPQDRQQPSKFMPNKKRQVKNAKFGEQTPKVTLNHLSD